MTLISIHTALAGCDDRTDIAPGIYYPFQSTQPSQAVTAYNRGAKARLDISIHTALAGCDDTRVSAFLLYKEFQSTQPSQAVTMVPGI